jgi:hypothetical protein
MNYEADEPGSSPYKRQIVIIYDLWCDGQYVVM